MPIDPIGTGAAPTRQNVAAPAGGQRFATSLAQMLHDVNKDQVDAASEIKRLVSDGDGSIHEAMAAITKAEGSFRLLMEMRNRLVDGVNRLLQTRG